MKRKWLAALLTVAMTVGILSGCGGGGSDSAGTDAEVSTDTQGESQENSSGGVLRKMRRLPRKAKAQLMQRM